MVGPVPECPVCKSAMIPGGQLHGLQCVSCQKIVMPLLAAVADVHLGNFRDFGGKTEADGLNARGRLTVLTLGKARDRAAELGCRLVVCGDLFHHKRPEPAIIAHAQMALNRARVAIIPGNHDTIDATAMGGNTACATVGQQAVVYDNADWTQPQEDTAIYYVPFDARMPMAQFLEERLHKQGAPFKQQALVTHVGVVDDNSPPWLRDAGDAIHKDRLFDLMEREDIVVAFVGNYHQHREWGRNGRKIVQIGALNPTGFGDAGLEGYGGLAVWYGGTNVVWESVPGPRFVRHKNVSSMPPKKPDGCTVFVRADRGTMHFVDVESNAAYYDGYEEVDPEPSFVEAQDLAKPDRLVEGAEAALEEYVSKMPLPEGLGRAEVLDMVKSLWRRAT